MRPLIWEGQHCVVVVPLEDEPKIDDLLLFRQPRSGKERNIIHRLVEIREEEGETIYITRGDNRLGCETVYREDIIGRVAEVHRISGFRPWHAIHAKTFSMADVAYRRYSGFWASIWPVRRIYYLCRAHANGLRVRLRRLLRSS